MTQNEDQSEITHLRKEVSQLRQQQERRQAVKIIWLRVLSVTVMIAVLASLILGRIDLHVQAHPQTSLMNILIQDVLLSFISLMAFGVAVLIFNQTFAANPNESWIERFLKKPPDRR